MHIGKRAGMTIVKDDLREIVSNAYRGQAYLAKPEYSKYKAEAEKLLGFEMANNWEEMVSKL